MTDWFVDIEFSALNAIVIDQMTRYLLPSAFILKHNPGHSPHPNPIPRDPRRRFILS